MRVLQCCLDKFVRDDPSRDYQLPKGRRLITLWFMFISFFLLYAKLYGRNDKTYNLGPHPETTVMGIPIDTGLAFCALVAFLVFTQAIESIVHLIYGPWLNNSVFDHKAQHIDGTLQMALFDTAFYGIFRLAADGFTLLTFFTQELQYFMFSGTTDVLVTMWRVYVHYKQKNENPADIGKILPTRDATAIEMVST